MVKIERTFPAPKSLEIEAKKKSGSYSEPDVVTQLKEDFHNKCYICGMADLQDPQVEHLLPHMNGKYPERKFDWNNLFWSCGHCNNVKNREEYSKGIVDCCKEDPEELMLFRLQEDCVQVESRDGNNNKASITAQLIMDVFNMKNTGMREYKSKIRLEKLTVEMNKLYRYLEELEEHPDSVFYLKMLKALLSKKSSFAAFKRNYIRENQEKYQQFMNYIV